MPDDHAAEAVPDATFWDEQEPQLAAVILASSYVGDAGAEALMRALHGEMCGDGAAADFWIEVYGCIRNLG